MNNTITKSKIVKYLYTVGHNNTVVVTHALYGIKCHTYPKNTPATTKPYPHDARPTNNTTTKSKIAKMLILFMPTQVLILKNLLRTSKKYLSQYDPAWSEDTVILVVV